MGHDLDDEELEATRNKFHGVNTFKKQLERFR